MDEKGRSDATDAGRRTRVVYSSGQLLKGLQEVIIEHKGTEYRLRHTSLGKLILTK